MIAGTSSTPAPRRAIVIGASNVTRGMATVAANAGALLGTPLQLLVAAGRGRSYGLWSRVLARGLPPVLDSGLWRVAQEEPLPTHALVTDVGNDVIYGCGPEEILAWVDECLVRLQALRVRTTLARLPLHRLERVKPLGYAAFRFLIVPGVRTPPLAEALRRARAVHEGLAALAASRGATLIDPAPEWYGIDPVHLRVSRHAIAWRRMLAGWSDATLEVLPAVEGRWMDTLHCAMTMPQVGAMCGVPFGHPDGPPGRVRVDGVDVALY